MRVSGPLKSKYLLRFDKLISDGKELVDSIGRSFNADDALVFADMARTLLHVVLPGKHPNRKRLESPTALRIDAVGLRSWLAMLVAARDDFSEGFFDDLSGQVEAEVASDYLGQAKNLLEHGATGQHEFVPAAVLAGAVLERGLRTLCNSQNPAIPTVKANGEPLTMNPLIDELKNVGVFNELRAKELRSWAGIRNAAAHGEFEKFNREQVERMVSGISSFLAEKL